MWPYLHVISRTAYFFYKLQKCQKLYTYDNTKKTVFWNKCINKKNYLYIADRAYITYFKNQPFEWFI